MCKKIKKNHTFFQFFIFISIFSLFFTNLYASNDKIIGNWKTIDDVSGKPRSLISISKNDNQFIGKIIKVYPRKGEVLHERCVKCQGSKHNQLIIGLPILLVNDVPDALSNACEILDPKNGKTYHCQLDLQNNGKEMKVRGYIGLPIIGRTQIWHRQ